MDHVRCFASRPTTNATESLFLPCFLPSTQLQLLIMLKSLTTCVSRRLVNRIKFYSETVIPELRMEHDGLLVIVNVVDRTIGEDQESGVLQATYNSLAQSVRIEVVVPMTVTGPWFAEFIPSFKRSLRHELEHYRQHQRSGSLLGDVLKPHVTVAGNFPGKLEQSPWKSVGQAARYFLNPLEVEAHVVGLKMEAQTRRVPFYVVLRETVKKVYKNLLAAGFSTGGSRLVGRRVYEVWGFYALTRYSYLRTTKKPTTKVLDIAVERW